MIKLSELISLPVINLCKLKIEGYVERACVDANKKQLANLLVYNDENDEYKVMEYKNIYKTSNNAIFIANSSKITLYENKELSLKKLVCPLNAICYDLEGTKIGKVDEINLENSSLHSIEINGKTYPRNHIIGLSDELILLSEKKVSLSKFKEKNSFNFKQPNTTNIVSIQKVATPTREITGYNFLLKRKVKKDILNDNGEVLAKAGAIINTNLINKLKYYGKLRELTLNSK